MDISRIISAMPPLSDYEKKQMASCQFMKYLVIVHYGAIIHQGFTGMRIAASGSQGEKYSYTS